GPHHGQAAPYYHQRKRASPLPETLVRDARVCQGRQGRLLLPSSAEVQNQVRDVRLQRQGEPRRRRHVADRLRAERVDCHRRGKDRRSREESGELSTELATKPSLSRIVGRDEAFPWDENAHDHAPKRVPAARPSGDYHERNVASLYRKSPVFSPDQ